MENKDKKPVNKLLVLRNLLIVFIIIGAIVAFFFSYNVFMVDHLLEDLRFALDQTGSTQSIGQMGTISLLLDDVLINEVASLKMDSLTVTNLEFVRNVMSTGGVKGQINDVEFLLDRLVKTKEKERGTMLLAFDRMNKDFQGFVRFLTKEFPAGALRSEMFRSAAKADLTILDAAKKYEGERKFEEAASAYEEFIQAYPAYPQLRFVKLQLASVYFKAGEYREAQRLYRKLIDEAPQSNEAKVAGILMTKAGERIKKLSERERLGGVISQLVKGPMGEDYKELSLVDAYLAQLDKETRDMVVYIMQGVKTGPPAQEGEADLTMIETAKKMEDDWRLPEAQALYEEFIAKYPDYENIASIKFVLAGVYLKSIQHEKALLAYEEIVNNYPTSKEADLAKKLAARTKEIISIYQKRRLLVEKILKLKTAPELAQAYYNLGIADIYIFDLKDAEESFKKTIIFMPNTNLSKKAEFMLAWVYKFGANYEKGIESFLGFVEKYSSDPLAADSVYQVADAYYKSGKFEEAAKFYEDVSDKFAYSPVSEVALAQAGYTYLYNLHNPMRASEAFKKLSAKYPEADVASYVSASLVPTTERSYRDYGFILLREGSVEEAKEAFKKAITINREDGWAYCGLSTAYTLSSSFEDAVETAAEGVKRVQDEYTHAALAFAYDRKKDYLKAIDQYSASVSKNPNYLVGHYNLGRDCLTMGWYDMAITEFKKTIKLEPDFAEAHNNLGVAYWYKGQVVDAEYEYKEAASSRPQMAESYYNLGILYDISGRYQKAAENFKKVLSIIPDLEIAQMRLEQIERKLRK
ncbi:MAG: tetratricopeptide repeat protein [Candidatus Omnitrophica bacterium]|nr:tetratricopeptide repeat protein [Candidatus Omnitrophota bacterium]